MRAKVGCSSIVRQNHLFQAITSLCPPHIIRHKEQKVNSVRIPDRFLLFPDEHALLDLLSLAGSVEMKAFPVHCPYVTYTLNYWRRFPDMLAYDNPYKATGKALNIVWIKVLINGEKCPAYRCWRTCVFQSFPVTRPRQQGAPHRHVQDEMKCSFISHNA